jgi:hypothetical protein
MATIAQIEANRRNARRSTGPVTPAGKAVSSRNATTHGILSRDTVLPEENPQDLERLLRDYQADFRPASAAEAFLVRQMAQAQWRLQRLSRVETGIFDCFVDDVEMENVPRPGRPEPPPLEGDAAEARRYDHDTAVLGRAFIRGCQGPEALPLLSRYEASIRRAYYKAFEELRRIRTLPPENCETNPIPSAA